MARLDRPWRELKRSLLKNAEFRRAYEGLEPEFQMARALIALRASKGFTQQKMAAKAAIQRPMLSRLEGAKDIPTLPTLVKLASAIGAKVEIRFVDRKNHEIRNIPPVRVTGRYRTVAHERAR